MMRSGSTGISEGVRNAFGVGLQRGTTVIRCTPPPAFEGPASEDRTYFEYYDDVERRRNLAPYLRCSVCHAGPVRCRSKSVPRKCTAPRKNTKAALSSGETDCQYEDDLLHGIRQLESFEAPPPTTEYCRTVSGLEREGDIPKNLFLQTEKGDQDCATTSALPEAQVSPRVEVNWGQFPDRDACASEAVPTYTGQLVDGTIVRGYIDIAHALLRHFEEALGTKQRLTAGSLDCAETVCKALNTLQSSNYKLKLLVQRILNAVRLLHKRKILEERDALDGDAVYNEVEFPYPLEATTNSLSGMQAHTYPLYVYRSRPMSQRQMYPRSAETIYHTLDGEAECGGDSTMQAPQNVRIQKSRVAGPPPPKATFVQDVLRVPVPCTDEASPVVQSPSRQSLAEVEKRYTKSGSALNTTVPLPVTTRKTADEYTEGVLRTGSRVNIQVSSSESPAGPFLRAPSAQLPQTSLTRQGSKETPPSSLGHSEGAKQELSLNSLPKTNTREPQPASGILRTQLVGPRTEGGSTAGHFTRYACCSMPFRESEGSLHVRPLVLSETRTLEDKDHSQWKEDIYRASAAEALLLVKFAIDLILSGEGPEYVEKQFFKYFRFDNYKTHERPKISEGLTPAQGKYLILRYAISKIEGDYGNTPEAADPNLYLPDLRKMEGIILGDDSFQQRNRESEREKAFHQDEGGDSQRSQSTHWLPERSPEERMERHLPLSILSLPAVYSRPVGGHSESCSESSLPGRAQAHRGASSSNPRQPTASTAISNNGALRAAAANEGSCLPKPPPILGGYDPTTSDNKPRGISSKDAGHVVGAAASVPMPTTPAPPVLPDGHAVQDRAETQQRSSSLSVTASQQVTPIPRVLPPIPSSNPGDISGLPAKSRNIISSDKPAMKFVDSRNSSRSRLQGQKAGLDCLSIGDEGFKLSSRNIVRDTVSGAVTTVVFEPSKNVAEQSLLDTATSAALHGISASRSQEMPAALPE